jgi:hypothetical protein
MVDLMRKFDLTAAAVSFAVHRGEKIAKNYQLALSDICISAVVPHAQGGAATWKNVLSLKQRLKRKSHRRNSFVLDPSSEGAYISTETFLCKGNNF